MVHTEWGRHWSGGTQQVALLLEGLAQRGIRGCLVCQEGSMLAERMQGKVALKTFNLRGEHDLFTWRKFAQWLKVFKERQESLGHKLLVHVHSRKGALPTLLIARCMKLPTILHWRVAAPIRLPIRLLADAVIAISEAARVHACKAGMPTERIFLIQSAIHTEKFAPPNKDTRLECRKWWGVEGSEFVVTSTGRMAPGKGHEVLLKAISQLSSDDRPIAILAGNGPEWEKLQQLACELRIRDFVHFVGFQNDIRPVLWAADVFVHVPTYFPEGVSVAVLEAMAAGLPVIATPVGGIPEVVRDGETGLLVPPNDHKALAEAILKLRQDEGLRTELGKQAQKWAQENHDVRQLPERVIQVYNQVTATSPRT